MAILALILLFTGTFGMIAGGGWHEKKIHIPIDYVTTVRGSGND